MWCVCVAICVVPCAVQRVDLCAWHVHVLCMSCGWHVLCYVYDVRVYGE